MERGVVSYYRHVSIQTRALRGCDDDHFFLFFSFSFLSAHTKRATARPPSSWCCLCVPCFARSNCIISWWCLFSCQKSLGYVLDPKRRRREEDATTETKKNQQPTKKRLRRNRSLRAYRYIHTNMYIYIIFLLLRNQPTEQRAFESSRIRAKYPDRIPVIVEKSPKSDVPELDKKKYLVPSDLTVGQFVYVIRKRVKLSAEKAIFVFVNNALPPTASLMSTIYEENKDEDGFLYIQYSGENTFGRRCLDDDLKA